MFMRRLLHALVFLGLATLSTACDEHDHGAFDLDHVCGDLRRATPQNLDAGASADAANLPSLASEHQPYTLSLPTTDTGTRRGFARIAQSARSGVGFFVEQDEATLIVRDEAGAQIFPSYSSRDTASCDRIAYLLIFDLALGTYTLEFAGPAALTSVTVLVERGAVADIPSN